MIVTNNMFGDIITDLGAALQGGLGMAGSANLHPGRTSMFEPVHGSAPKYAGLGTANPMAAMVTVGLLLSDLGHENAADQVEVAVRQALSDGVTTRDLGGRCSTAWHSGSSHRPRPSWCSWRRRYSTFCTCSRIRSSSALSSTTLCASGASFAFEPTVLASRPSSCSRKSRRRPTGTCGLPSSGVH